jgi:hypothetical protein
MVKENREVKILLFDDCIPVILEIHIPIQFKILIFMSPV